MMHDVLARLMRSFQVSLLCNLMSQSPPNRILSKGNMVDKGRRVYMQTSGSKY